MDNLEQVDDDELENIIERAREMEDHYGHYFDMIIIYRYLSHCHHIVAIVTSCLGSACKSALCKLAC